MMMLLLYLLQFLLSSLSCSTVQSFTRIDINRPHHKYNLEIYTDNHLKYRSNTRSLLPPAFSSNGSIETKIDNSPSLTRNDDTGDGHSTIAVSYNDGHECDGADTYNSDAVVADASDDQYVPISILFENDCVLIVNKPCGVPHHDDPVVNVNAATNQKDRSKQKQRRMGILSHVRHMQSRKQIPYTGRLYGIHRLDAVTSGILVLAKTQPAAAILSHALRTPGTIQKYYVAVSSKKAKKKKQGLIQGDMKKSRRGAWILTRSQANPAKSRFFTAGLGDINQRYNSYCGNENQLTESSAVVSASTVILFKPLTGRTHQLRVAAKSVGLPILGDSMYSGGNIADGSLGTCTEATVMTLRERTYLHATAIHFSLPQLEELYPGCGTVTVLNLPPFGSLLYPPPPPIITASNGKTVDSLTAADDNLIRDTTTRMTTGLNLAVTTLFQKHCDCQPIIDQLILSSSSSSYV